MQETVRFPCDACGETMEIPVDASAGRRQEFVEDCPVCCRPNVIVLTIEADGFVRVSNHLEQF